MTTQSILIIGTGALATLFAARLAATGVDVTMLGTWPAGLDALRKEGARLAAADGVERAYPVRVTDDPAECRRARFALVLVKAWQTERAARQLASCLREDGLALTLQNGLGNREILAERLGLGRVALGVTTTGATLLAPGLIRLGGEGTLSLEAHPRLAALEAMLRAAGFAVNVVADARSLVWGKLVINAAINPLTALLRVPNGELLQRPAARFLMSELAREAAAVARAQGVELPFENPESAAEEVARRTAANRSSMLQDVLRGAPTEIDAICGVIVHSGEAAGIPAPLNRLMWQLVGALYGNPDTTGKS
ncbi:MAG: 2-dehydropantoate 2-reductase [Chloroflexi bacterium]|nr:2-dehydropantoate 2-reductase [Chloroflexota bacterium]